MAETELNITKKDNGFCINNPEFFLTFSDFLVSDGIDIVENINILKGNYDFEELAEATEDFNQLEASYISHCANSINYFHNKYGDLELFTFMESDVEIEEFTDNLDVANSKKGFEDGEINISHIIYINKTLSPKVLLKVYKKVVKTKATFFQSLNLPIHIQNILNNNDFLAILANVPEDSFEEENIYEDSVDIVNNQYDDENISLESLLTSVEEAVIISCEDALTKLELNFGILDYLVSEGILIGDLVEAGLELVEGVEVTDEIKTKLEKQILKSLSDINVIALLMAAIRTEDDFTNNRIREVDVSDDPAYLYSDEVLGLAISNQIAGTKATFNFKRYDEAKPGIIYGLGPMVDDIFAGLIAGCMSKIFEE
ncbi:MAG: phosphatidylglycerophosphatase A [Methanobrevibacter woesei]|uniref:phosphatidylglycerophosphatase A n=1 Tax=Methanobrevibacter woesei TaxID=190976 RepID=UPI0023F1E530|nr:phosphatidylglycerophosphatase A [Methanobrevibacter woesei]MCI7291639.1 phosphatidylglycerophosphatase A [Methanobrevibacter woesei]